MKNKMKDHACLVDNHIYIPYQIMKGQKESLASRSNYFFVQRGFIIIDEFFRFHMLLKKNYFVLLICAHQIYTVWLYICVKTKFGPTSRVYIFLKKLKKKMT